MSFDFSCNEVHVGTWHQDFTGFFGVKPRMRFGLTETTANALTLTQDLGQLKAGTRMSLPAASNAWHGTPLLAGAVDAEVFAVDNLNRPCLWRTRRGEGYVWLFGFPVEHSPAWTEGEYSDRAALLREIFRSGVRDHARRSATWRGRKRRRYPAYLDESFVGRPASEFARWRLENTGQHFSDRNSRVARQEL